jgi:serine/threonine protein kinase
VADFARVVETIVALRHSHLLPIRDHGIADGLAYLIYDFVNGEDLGALAGTVVPGVDAVALLAPVAAALDYVHERGAVHGLLKPGNILRQRDGAPVLTDLGLAGNMETMRRRAGVSALIGAPPYMAPEQVEGNGAPSLLSSGRQVRRRWRWRRAAGCRFPGTDEAGPARTDSSVDGGSVPPVDRPAVPRAGGVATLRP